MKIFGKIIITLLFSSFFIGSAFAKQQLHKSIENYEKPILEWKTKKFRIRIDNMGNYNYRYSAWSIKKKVSESPDIILYKGEQVFEGSGGNHYYLFKNGKYSYRCGINVLGASAFPPGYLEVYKGDTLLLSEPVTEVVTKFNPANLN